MAEGAAILVLEREDHARARGAEILGVVAGTAVTSDAVDIVAADPAMQRRVMQKAIAAAGLAPGTSASSTPTRRPRRSATGWKRKRSGPCSETRFPSRPRNPSPGTCSAGPERSAPSSRSRR